VARVVVAGAGREGRKVEPAVGRLVLVADGAGRLADDHEPAVRAGHAQRRRPPARDRGEAPSERPRVASHREGGVPVGVEVGQRHLARRRRRRHGRHRIRVHRVHRSPVHRTIVHRSEAAGATEAEAERGGEHGAEEGERDRADHGDTGAGPGRWATDSRRARREVVTPPALPAGVAPDQGFRPFLTHRGCANATRRGGAAGRHRSGPAAHAGCLSRPSFEAPVQRPALRGLSIILVEFYRSTVYNFTKFVGPGGGGVQQ
jgi:hypothetical protein